MKLGVKMVGDVDQNDMLCSAMAEESTTKEIKYF